MYFILEIFELFIYFVEYVIYGWFGVYICNIWVGIFRFNVNYIFCVLFIVMDDQILQIKIQRFRDYYNDIGSFILIFLVQFREILI